MDAMYRELWEEVGLHPRLVDLLAVTQDWLRYRLPKRYVRHGQHPLCIGQKQKWFLLKLRCKDEDVNLLKTHHPEFDDWRWVSYWYPVRQVVITEFDDIGIESEARQSRDLLLGHTSQVRQIEVALTRAG